MKYAPKKVFIKENNKYVEISYDEYCRREKENDTYKSKKFLPMYGMIMEVDEDFYKQYYKEKERYEYIAWRTKHKDVLYSDYDTDECSGEDILIAPDGDVAEQVVDKLMIEKLRSVLPLLSDDEKLLIHRHYFENIPETELATIYGITQQAISKRMLKIRAKLKKLLEN